MDFVVKNTQTQIRGKTSRFVNTNPREFENLYILLEFIKTAWISKLIKIYKPITPPKDIDPIRTDINPICISILFLQRTTILILKLSYIHT